jgi:branched-chain amino acid transport system permease protein
VTGIAITEGMTDIIFILPMVLVVSGLFALVTGAISLRTSGVYFIMITLAFGQMLFFTLSSLAHYGGDDGLTLWDTASFFDTAFFQYDGGLFYAVLIILTLCWGFVSLLSGARFGRVLRAAKQNRMRVETMGFNTFHYQLLAYVIAGMIAGVAGFLFACQAEFVSPAISTWQRSGDLIIMVVLGGMATRNGPLLGALFFILVEEGLSLVLHEWRLIFGPLLVVIVLFANGGLAGLLRRLGVEE